MGGETIHGPCISLNNTPNCPKLQFDLINPGGNGAVKYICYTRGQDTAWHELNANEISFPELAADKYYVLSVVAYDEVWKSNKINICLYVVPYWWQTATGKKAVWAISCVLLLLFVYSIVFATKRIVTKNHAKKSMQLELELKSIYSQLNPHFIFNSLGSALLFIQKNRMEEAYLHVTKFSRLLRSYIRSSRNKYLTIAEEIKNLRDYIELQQTRFKNRFDYEILVDDNIAAAVTKIPSLLIQPFVENAINHGLFHFERKGMLKIHFLLKNIQNGISIIIDDDGIGRKESKLLKIKEDARKESFGDDIIKDLVNIFNKYEKTNIDIQYIDKKEPQTGTTVIITIKQPGHDKK